MGKVLFAATVARHFKSFHLPYLQWFKEQGWVVHTVAGDDEDVPFCDKQYVIPIARSPYRYTNIIALKVFKRILEEEKYDIIHCHTPMGGVIARLAARKARKDGTKVLYTAHGFHFYKGAPLKNWLLYYPIEKWLARYTDVLITINKEDYDRAQRFLAKRVEYVHGVGADGARFVPYPAEKISELKEKMGLANHNIILCVGELNKNKNQATVISAVKEVVKTLPNTKLLLAGRGANYDALVQLRDNLGLTENVVFLGYTRNIEYYINISDVVVSASFREGLPINVVEALLCRKPVVASLNRGHKELVEPGVNGYLANPHESSEFSQYIVKIIKDKAFDTTYSSEAWSRIHQFTVENVRKKLADIYCSTSKIKDENEVCALEESHMH